MNTQCVRFAYLALGWFPGLFFWAESEYAVAVAIRYMQTTTTKNEVESSTLNINGTKFRPEEAYLFTPVVNNYSNAEQQQNELKRKHRELRKAAAFAVAKQVIPWSAVSDTKKNEVVELSEAIEFSALTNLPAYFLREITREASLICLKQTKKAAIEWINEFEEFALKQPGIKYAGFNENDIRAEANEIAERKEDELRTLRSKDYPMMAMHNFINREHEAGVQFKARRESDYDKVASKLIDPKTWRRKIRSLGAQAREMVAYKLKQVGGANKNKYASQYNVEWRKQRKAQMLEWASEQIIWENERDKNGKFPAMMIKDGENYRQMTLLDCIRTDEAKMNELYTVFTGVESYAKIKDMTWSFLTVTLPGEWHPNAGVNHQNGKKQSNKKWNEATPREAASVLLNDWARIRALFKKHDIDVLGLRVAEPQKDGTPHLHLMMFHNKNDVEAIDEILKMHWGRGQRSKKMKADMRWNAPALQIISGNEERGSAASYIMKYIAKGVNVQIIREEEKEKINSMEDVEAWRAIWNIRAFQWFGIRNNLTLWRTLRMNHENPPEGVLKMAWAHAQSGEDYKADFGAFLQAMEDVQLDKIYEENRFGNKQLFGFVDGVDEETGELKLLLCKPNTYNIGTWVTVNPNYPSARGSAPALPAAAPRVAVQQVLTVGVPAADSGEMPKIQEEMHY